MADALSKNCCWEWQQPPNKWRRYPCTISYKLNSIDEGQTIYVSIFEWVYKITKQTASTGIQMNIFTQSKRRIRRTSLSSNTSLYFNYSLANIVLLNSLHDYEQRIKDIFYKSMPKKEYAITDMIQLSMNNDKYQNYRKHLEIHCKFKYLRRDEIEIFVWTKNDEAYAHSDHLSKIMDDNTTSICFCRAICPNNDVESENIIDQIPLYQIHFERIGKHWQNKSSFKSIHSYSQPLLSLKQSYGSFTKSNNKKNTDSVKSWHELMKIEESERFCSTFDINNLIHQLLSLRTSKQCTYANLKIGDIENILIHSKNVLMQQPIFLELEAPINIVGDIHGQYYDLLRLFEAALFPPFANYLFLGDYVDRGGHSLECILLLLCYKIKCEENVFLLRGNHEEGKINRIYGFYDECKRRYSVRLWRKFVDVFNCLPIAAVVNDKIFCVHGGLSPELMTPHKNVSFDGNIKQIQRPTNVADCGLICDLLWSDPSFDVNGFAKNNDRGVSYYFGKDVVDSFNTQYDIDLICRAHQVVEDGYEFFNDRALVTIFSAPNYCGEFDNCAALMTVDANLKCSFILMDPQRKNVDSEND